MNDEVKTTGSDVGKAVDNVNSALEKGAQAIEAGEAAVTAPDGIAARLLDVEKQLAALVSDYKYLKDKVLTLFHPSEW